MDSVTNIADARLKRQGRSAVAHHDAEVARRSAAKLNGWISSCLNKAVDAAAAADQPVPHTPETYRSTRSFERTPR